MCLTCWQVEDLIREVNVIEAYDILELFCELLVARLQIIDVRK